MRRGWWLAAFGVVLLSGCDAPTRPEHTDRVRQVALTGVLHADGTVDLRAEITYPSTDGGPLRLGAPTLGTVDQLRLDGSPRSASGESVDVDPRGATPRVEWTLRGAVERYTEGAIVTLPIWTPPAGVNADDLRAKVSGALQLPAAPVGKVRWHGASPASVTTGELVRFDGAVGTTTASALTLVVPADALPEAPLLPGGSRLSSYETRQATLDATDAHIAGDLANDRRREDLEAGLYWGAVGLEIAIPFVITLFVILRAATVRRRATRDVPDEISDQPSDLAPAVVALLCAEGRDIGSNASAATILDLAHRRILKIEGISGERYTLAVSGSSARPGEMALLAALGDVGAITGPPLPVRREGEWWRALRRDVVATARGAGLLRRRYRSGLFLTAVIALAVTTIPLYARSPEALVGGVVVATILGAIPFVGGYVLTGAGHRERARWEAYRQHLDGADLVDVPAPGVVVWESALVYAAALGIARAAIEDLS